MTKTVIIEKLRQKKDRLQLYYDREKYLLSPDAVQSYGIGTRNLQRYYTDLEDVQKLIKQLEDEIAELEGLLDGHKPRKSVRVLPRDL